MPLWTAITDSIWVKMPRKNNGLINVLFSQSLWLKCALLCLPWSLELDCSWTEPQCDSPQVISLAKSKYLHIFGIFFWQTLAKVQFTNLVNKINKTWLIFSLTKTMLTKSINNFCHPKPRPPSPHDFSRLIHSSKPKPKTYFIKLLKSTGIIHIIG